LFIVRYAHSVEPKEDIPRLFLAVARVTPANYAFYIIVESVISMWERINRQLSGEGKVAGSNSNNFGAGLSLQEPTTESSSTTGAANKKTDSSSHATLLRYRQDVMYLADQICKEASRFNLPAKEMQALDEKELTKGSADGFVLLLMLLMLLLLMLLLLLLLLLLLMLLLLMLLMLLLLLLLLSLLFLFCSSTHSID
jgi:hypothetical protein